MIYRCRSVKPHESTWRDVESDTPESAANEYHCQFGQSDDYIVTDDRIENDCQRIGFMLVEVENYGEWVSRMFYKGIYRKGGIKRLGQKTFYQRLVEAAKTIGWEKDPMRLVVEGWEEEQSEWK